MNDFNTIKFFIPADSEFFIRRTFSNCGEIFKLSVKVFQEDFQILQWCPSCGLHGQSFIGKEEIELAENMAANATYDMLNDFFKGLEKNTKRRLLYLKLGKSLRLNLWIYCFKNRKFGITKILLL
ncbi:hypothetical protein [Enterococcus sp. AZ109]|uniref:hypothetical protein n=1 Tax=Enterococcus sp. AZ109 TaxID=2774634 RepID=UPI003F248B28